MTQIKVMHLTEEQLRQKRAEIEEHMRHCCAPPEICERATGLPAINFLLGED